MSKVAMAAPDPAADASTPSFSIVIPVLNEAATLPPLLRGLRVQFPRAQLLVVDGGSGDDSVARASPWCDEVLTSPPGRAVQMNRGARAAAGDYLLFLHADTRLQISQSQLLCCLAGHPRWGFFPVRLEPTSPLLRLVAIGMNLRSRLTRVATGDQCLVVETSLFHQLGGFADIPLMEDVEMSKRLRRVARPLVLSPALVTSSRRWRSRGVLRTILQMWWLRLAYFLGADPARLWRSYYGH